jgi:hypothetical protein
MTSTNGVQAQTRSLKEVDTALRDIETWAQKVSDAKGDRGKVQVDGSLTRQELGYLLVQVGNGNLPPLADRGEAEGLANAYANAGRLANRHGSFTQEGQQLANGNAAGGNDTSIEYNSGNVGEGTRVDKHTDTTLRSGKSSVNLGADAADRLGELAGMTGGQATLGDILRTVLGGGNNANGLSAQDLRFEDTRKTDTLELGTTLTPSPAGKKDGPVTDDLLQELGLKDAPRPEAKGSPLAAEAGLPFAGLEKFLDKTTFTGASGTSWDVRKSASGPNGNGDGFEAYDVDLTDRMKYSGTNDSAKVVVFDDGTVRVSAETLWTRDKDVNPNDSEGPFTDKASPYVGDPDKLARTLIDDMKATMGPVTVTRSGPGQFQITPQR